MNIGIYAGYWSTNIGNSYFQRGCEYLFRQAFPDANIFFIADEAGYINPKAGNPANSFNSILNIKMDIAVILGPFIRPEVSKIAIPTLLALKKKGIRVIALGVGMMDYQKSTIEYANKVLNEIKPDIFMTRDNPTYEAFSKSCKLAYNGIDLGFFSSDVYGNAPGLDGDYVTFNFDQLPEPIVSSDQLGEFPFEFNGKGYSLSFNKRRKKFAEKGFLYQIFDGLFLSQKYNESFDGLPIIRTDHRYNPAILKRIYRYPNTIASDIPEPYWAAYKNTKLTISNRVHACVATLSFGNPAWLFTKSPRSYLLDRVGVTDIRRGPITVSTDYLADEKLKMIDFIKYHL